ISNLVILYIGIIERTLDVLDEIWHSVVAQYDSFRNILTNDLNPDKLPIFAFLYGTVNYADGGDPNVKLIFHYFHKIKKSSIKNINQLDIIPLHEFLNIPSFYSSHNDSNSNSVNSMKMIGQIIEDRHFQKH